MKKRKKVFLLLLYACACCLLSAQKTSFNSFEFVNQDIKDILFIFSSYSKIPIIADDTVNGVTTFQFASNDFTQAFDAFLQVNRLYVEKTETVWHVSKIQIELLENNVCNIDAFDVTIAQLLDKIASTHTADRKAVDSCTKSTGKRNT